MTLATNESCNQITATTPDSDLLGLWYSGQELDVDFTWAINDCTNTTVRLPNRYDFDGTISNCSFSSENGYTFRLNITGITVSYVSLITVESSTDISSVSGVSQLSYLLNITAAQFSTGNPQITFKIKDTNGNEYTIVYTIDIQEPLKCGDIFIDSVDVTYPDLPCGVAYDSESETMTFTYGFFFGAPCDSTLALPCSVYNMAIESETSCIFVCCEYVCLATSAFELKDLTETLDVYQALVYLNELHAQGSTCVDCNQMVAIYTHLRSLTKTNGNVPSTGCGCGTVS
jgi:hypothetical protein